MRSVGGFIDELWRRGGPFVGDEARPHGRVTVQLPWQDGLSYPEWILRPTMENIGLYTKRGAPLRYFQKEDNSQVEIELPSVSAINIDRSIDSGAGTCHISLMNQRMEPIGEDVSPADIGQPGYYTFDRGSSPLARSRWGHEANPYWGLLYPNSILRTYQGYGGADKTLEEAINAGNLMLTGLWIIDTVQLASSGTLEIECRDSMKFLVDQMIYSPPIPKSGDLKYPLLYQRWTIELGAVKASEKRITHTSPGEKRAVYRDSSSDRWYWFNADIHGHRPQQSVDGNPSTYWLSEGNSSPERPFCTSYIEFDCGEDINSVYLSPWAGGYQLFVSIMENGQWVGSAVVPYDHTPLIGHQPTVVDTGADIPYVMSTGVPWETPKEYMLPRAYRAQRVRLSFRNHVRSEFGPWYYRVGVREVGLRVTGDGTVVSTATPSISFGAAPHPQAGYWTINDNDHLDTFGDAVEYPISPSQQGSPEAATFTGTVRRTSNGQGYWRLDNLGHVRAYGNAAHHGDFQTIGEAVLSIPPLWPDIAFELAPTHTDGGYWIIRNDGRVYAFGDAVDYVSSVPYLDEIMVGTGDGHPTDMGLWLCNQAGVVYAYGAAVHYGDATVASKVTSLRSTSTGNGYWILETSGKVHAFGDAWEIPVDTAHTTPDNWFDTCWDLIPAPDDLGYGVLRGTGHIFSFGSFKWFGEPIPGSQAQHRRPGNYLDYSDVIRDLALWAGFLLYEDVAPSAMPDVFGSIETTGTYSDEDLPIEMFDKKPFIDAMNEIKEIVGYLLYVDDDGSLTFTSPNWWALGNFDEDGRRINVIPEIDESVQLLNYSVSLDDRSIASEILITSEDPDASQVTTVTTRLVPPTAKALRGICKPFMWVNGYFQKKEEMDLMAELISLHTWFQQRVGSVSCAANPCIQFDDQVRIWERVTGETYVHYVRGVSTSMDLQQGQYSMELTTHWLGDKDNWAIDRGDAQPDIIDDFTFPGTPILVMSPTFTISDAAWNFVSHNQDKATGVVLGQETAVVTTMSEGDPPDDSGAANL